MFWYVARCKSGNAGKLVSALNRQGEMNAFIPKNERWRGRGGHELKFLIKELYPDYVFIKSKLDKESFGKRFKEFFKSIKGLIDLLEYEDVYPLNIEEQELLEKLLGDSDVIRHTTGKVVERRFVPTDGPLVGLEDKIKKVDKHNRVATLDSDILTGKLMVAINIIY